MTLVYKFQIRFICVIILFFITGFFSLSAQQVVLSGAVTDSLQEPLPNANLLAIPTNESVKMQFAITNQNGQYNINLQANESYALNVTFLGYQKVTDTINLKENTKRNFVLKEEAGTLEEILIKHKIPVIVKQDTLIYNADSFKDGSERKLRDVLKNLPGVEVDRDGNVTVNGKKVTKVLVEGKTFFTGDSKLAVDNIPADAAESIEVIDDYHDVAMFKGLEDSDEMAMNIKLKEDKKKFVFGSIEAGGGIKNRYVINPKLFYYSPKTNVSFIGDVNNIAENAFTMKEYLEFEGGMSRLLNDASSYFSLYNSDLARFLMQEDFTLNQSKFGALNVRQSLSRNTDLSGYVISSHTKTETRSETVNQYLAQENQFTENRTTAGAATNFFTLGKVTLNHTPRYEEEASFSSFFKISDNLSTNRVHTNSPMQDNRIEAKSEADVVQLKQEGNYSLKLNDKHTVTAEVIYEFNRDQLSNRWLTNQPILQGLIPLQDDEVYRILQNKSTDSHHLRSIFKDYWVLHRFHHLYTSVGVNLSFADFYNNDRQQLSDGTINTFAEDGFDNDFKMDALNTYLGVEYKFQKGITIFKPAAFVHYFTWQTRQFNNKNTYDKTLILPKLDVDFNFSSSEKLKFKYGLNTQMPRVHQLADRFILSNFNSVFRGNNQLENERFHSATLSYYKFKMFKGFRMNFMSSFRRKEKHFKNTTALNGIEQYNTVILFDNPEQQWNLAGTVSKTINDFRFTVNGSFNYMDFYQLVNSQERLNISKNISGTFRVKTLFKDIPSIEAGYTKSYNNYRAAEGVTNFENDQFFVNLDYNFWNDFIFKADYSYDVFRNRTSRIANHFDNANVSLFYQKEDSPWGFEVKATNIFDTTFKRENSFSDFLISDTKTYIFPRVILFKLSYNL